MFKRYLYLNYRAFSGARFWFARRITPAGWLAAAGLSVTALLGLDTTLSAAYQIFAFLFCLLLLAFVSMFFVRIPVDAVRSMPRFGSAGETFTYHLHVQNTSRRPQRTLALIEVLQDPRPSFEEFLSTPEPGEEKRNWYDRTYGYYRWEWLIDRNRQASPSMIEVPPLSPRGSAEIKIQLTPRRRGYLRFVSTTFMAPDPFGIFRRFRSLPLPQSILILPRRYPLPDIDFPGLMKYQQGGVTLASAVGESEEFVSLRDYRPGDPLRHIHWKSWAKTGEPIVKEFQDEFFVRHALVLDTFSPLAHSDVFEEAVSVAASFAYTIQSQDSLLDLMFVGPQAFCFTAGRGVGHTEQILEILASVKTCGDRSFDFLHNLVLQHSTGLSGCICVFLNWDDQRQRFVKHLKAIGLPILVCVIVEKGQSAQIDPGAMQDLPGQFHVLELGRIGEDLRKL